MIGPTYRPLANITLSSAASSVTFGSIPSTYRDLIVISNFTSTSSSDGLIGRFNSDSGSNYNYVRMWGENSSGFSSSSTSQTSSYLGDVPTTNRMFNRWQIMDYSVTDKHKASLVTHVYDPASLSYNVFVTANRWASTSAITSIVLDLNAGSFTSGSTFALYGIES